MDGRTNEVQMDGGLIGYAKDRMSRRAFARNALLGTAGLAADVKADANTDIAILQFALNLEYLEAEFYSIVKEGACADD